MHKTFTKLKTVGVLIYKAMTYGLCYWIFTPQYLWVGIVFCFIGNWGTGSTLTQFERKNEDAYKSFNFTFIHFPPNKQIHVDSTEIC